MMFDLLFQIKNLQSLIAKLVRMDPKSKDPPKDQITLTVSGNPIPEDFEIDLLAGWNLIAYWPQETQIPEDAFAELIDAGVLEMVTSYENGGLYFDPNGPSFLNTLTEVKNGFGYWVKVSGDYTGFAYPNQN
jgi:hypothetical protein